MYPNISKIYKDVPRYSAVPVRPVRGPGLGPGQAGPAAAWYFVYLGISLYVLDIFEYKLDIFGYIWIIFKILLICLVYLVYF